MPTIKFKSDAFRTNVMSYTRETDNHGVDACFWRELLQNARDAESKRVDITLTQDGEVYTVVFQDDGTGMTKEVLEQGMLSYAGSIKPNGSAGGFGMAKCLLVLAPTRCKIETNELAVDVQGINYEWLEVSEPIQGTRYTIVIDNTGFEEGKRITPTLQGLTFLMSRCDMREMKVYCNGERVKDTKLDNETKEVRDWDNFKMKAYHQPRGKPLKNMNDKPVLVVQHRGIWVMDITLGDDVKGCVWVNTDAEPKKVLNESRVSFSRYDIRDCIDTFIREITRAPKQALKTKKYVKRFDGGMTTIAAVKDTADAMVEAVVNAAPPEPEATGKRGAPVKPSTEQQEILLKELAMSAFDASGGETGYRLMADCLLPERLNIELNDSNEDISNKLATLVWSPAMMIVNEREQTVSPQWMPGTMGKQVKKLLLIWSEMCKQFLILSKAYGCTFGVGFIFSDEVAAQWRKEDDGTTWFLLNPLSKSNCIAFNMSSNDDRNTMISLACHEVCHQVIENNWHGDDFANKLTELMTITLSNLQLFNQIWKIR